MRMRIINDFATQTHAFQILVGSRGAKASRVVAFDWKVLSSPESSILIAPELVGWVRLLIEPLSRTELISVLVPRQD